MSSSAFFMEAAAKMVMLFCAAAGEMATLTRAQKATRIPARRFITGRSMRVRTRWSARKSGVADFGLRPAEAPFRQSRDRRTVGRDVAIGRHYSHPRVGGKALKTSGLRLGVRQVQHAP